MGATDSLIAYLSTGASLTRFRPSTAATRYRDLKQLFSLAAS
jgi:hypothetical protein